MFFLLILYTVALAALNGARMLHRVFWYDEMFSIKLIRMPISELISATANDVHPPLYYLILKAVCHFFGESPFVMHAVSFAPYILILILSLTIIRKWFGKGASFLFITLASLQEQALVYQIETRMYSWAVFFVLVSYLSLYAIMYRNRIAFYFILILSSLAAAYTHYYSLIVVAFFYLGLMVYALLIKRKMLRRVIFTWLITALGYVRWLLVLLETFKRTSGGWWLSWMPRYTDALGAIFKGKHNWLLFYIYVGVIAITVIWNIVLILTNRKYPENKEPAIELTWLLTGTAAVFGMIGFGVVISHLLRPMFIYRYVFNVALCAWITLSVGAARIRIKGIPLAAIALTLFVCFCGYSNYIEQYTIIRDQSVLVESSITKITDQFDLSDLVFLTDKDTDIRVYTYFRDSQRQKIKDNDTMTIPDLDHGKEYLMVLQEKIDAVVEKELAEANIDYTEIKADAFRDDPDRDAYLGDLNVFLYKLTLKN